MALICYVLQCDRSFIHAHLDKLLSEEQLISLENAFENRCVHMPTQYITGSQEFMSLNFIVNPSVLIPRNDTEILVESIIDIFSKNQKHINILDLCTGSGCISVSLAKYIPQSSITASDISSEALETAEKNALLNHVSERIKFIRSDLFENITDVNFDVIVCNPPYIPSSHIQSLMPEVKNFEPLKALDGGSNGLHFYQQIIEKTPFFLSKNGVLAFEVGINQSDTVRSLMENDFENIHVKKDLSNIDRVIWGRLKF
jgi:release factor glutamine methyltransferase